jgi:hypothetical protein
MRIGRADFHEGEYFPGNLLSWGRVLAYSSAIILERYIMLRFALGAPVVMRDVYSNREAPHRRHFIFFLAYGIGGFRHRIGSIWVREDLA